MEPQLPEPIGEIVGWKIHQEGTAEYWRERVYTADQMREYGRACIEGDETGWEAMDKIMEYARKVKGSRDVHSVYEVLDLIPALLAEIADLVRERDANAKDAELYRHLRTRDLDAIKTGGVFAGMTPDNYVLSGDDLDAAIRTDMEKSR